ncbi:MAG: hypothetical protein ACOX0U_09160 [Oscillospiraceae bacterium]
MSAPESGGALANLDDSPTAEQLAIYEQVSSSIGAGHHKNQVEYEDTSACGCIQRKAADLKGTADGV